MTGVAMFDVQMLGEGLPFAAAVDDLRQALGTGVCVVEAPAGSGKTTLAPPVVANALVDAGSTGRVVVTAPRRVAVRAAARRLAQLSGTPVGALVGFSVRGESRTSPSTRVEFVTPGLLVRRLLADPELTGVGAVVLDEVHERSLDTDLLVGMLAEVRALRDDLRLVAMSATLDITALAGVLGGGEPVPIVESPTAIHPLEVAWRPAPGPRTDERGVSNTFLDHVATVTLDALRAASAPELDDCDALVFCPGAREVGRVAATLRAQAPELDVLELHGRVDARDQDRAVVGRAPGEPRRVVVATSVAESSITVPGVRIVVDSGLAREPRRDAARGMSGLVTVACSRASAVQRAGRAARLGPGLTVRCYDEQTFARMPEQITPEMLTADLTQTALTLAAWGTPGGEGLALPTPPPDAALADAVAVLVGLGAVDPDGRITTAGRLLADVPTDPRLARALLDGASRVGTDRAAGVVAALSDDVRSPSADLSGAIAALTGPARRRWSSERDRLQRVADRNDRRGRAEPAGRAELRAVDGPATSIGSEHAEGMVVALAYPDRVARRVGDSVYVLAAGTRAALPASSPLQHHEWLAVADVARAEGRAARGTGAIIRLAAPLTRELAETAASHLLVDEVRATWSDGRVTGRRVQALGAIEFSSTPTKPAPAAARQAVADALAADGLSILRWNDAATTLRDRLAFCHHHLGEPWPAVDDTTLLERLDEWFSPELDRLAGGAKADAIDLVEPLRRLLPWPEAVRFDDLAPQQWQAPSGNRVRVRYATHDDAGAAPVVAVKLQECFGLTDTPRLADGRAPVQFHLLSPAGRPVAITDDLASFWAGPYAGVRADMRGRYPKHPWPDDPSTHVPTARTKRPT